MVFTAYSNIAPVLNGGGNLANAFDINGAPRVLIQRLKIKRFNPDGIKVEGVAQSNIIFANTIYSNQSKGIDFNWNAGIRYNIIYSNNFFGPNQSYGIYVLNTGKNQFRNNKLYNNSWLGIDLEGAAISNVISGNQIYSNSVYGIRIANNAGTPVGNSILSNVIFGAPQQDGIDLEGGSSNLIARNLIRNNTTYGIFLQGSAGYYKIINNTLYNNNNNGAYFMANTSSGTLFNNIFLSNGNTGINRATPNPVYAGYNDFYANTFAPTNGGVTWGPGNKLTNPLLNTTSFTITSASSPAVDTGTTNAPYTKPYNGNGPDMGWKESAFVYSIPVQLANSPWPKFRKDYQNTGLSPYGVTPINSTKKHCKNQLEIFYWRNPYIFPCHRQ